MHIYQNLTGHYIVVLSKDRIEKKEKRGKVWHADSIHIQQRRTSCIGQQESLISVLESVQKYSCHQQIWKTKFRPVNFSLDVKIQSQTEPQIFHLKVKAMLSWRALEKYTFFKLATSNSHTQHTFLVRKSSLDWSKQIISWSINHHVPKTSLITKLV